MNRSVKRSILSNVVSLGSIDFIGMLLPIVVMPWLTRSLGPIYYGEYLLFMSILVFGHTIIDYGVQYVGVRAVSREAGNRSQQVKLYSEYQGLRLVLLLAYLVVVASYFAVLGDHDKAILISTFGACYLFGYWLLSPWYLIAIGYRRLLLFTNLAPKLLTFAGLLAWVRTPDDFNVVLGLSTVPLLISSCYVVYVLNKQTDFRLASFSTIGNKLKEGNSVFLGLLAPNMYNMLPFIFIASYVDPVKYSQYGVAIRVTGVVMTVQMVISKAIYPFLASSSKNHLNKVIFGNLVVVAPLILFLIFFGETVLRFVLGDWTVGDTSYISILSISVLFVVISNSIGQGYLLPHDQDQLYRNISIRSSLISALLTVLLIIQLNVLGAALALLISRFIFAVDHTQSYLRLRRANLTG